MFCDIQKRSWQMDQYKCSLANEFGFTVYTLWSNNSVGENMDIIEKIIERIQPC